MDKRIFVISHTHWDREWYFTKSTFQMMNVDMMEHLLNILESDKGFSSFMLDGQLIALEDYLEIFPENKARIRALVQDNRLQIGPWYVLPDEYLASGEAHIRNFIEGMRLADDFGGGMRIGYLPDSFGHPSQMPQIIKGLGMQEMIFWRGTGPDVMNMEFIWEGKDGSDILALNMLYGYSNAANLKDDILLRFKRLDHEISKLLDHSGLNLALLMNGSDHIAPDARVPEWIEEYSKHRPSLTINHCSLTDYTREAHARANQVRLQRVSGELRSGYRAYLLGDTLSTRITLKQRQRSIEIMVENHLEPLFSLLSAQGCYEYPKEKFRYMWKQLLQNLPHDSICGCGSDAIHREMMLRYDQITEIGRHLFQRAQDSLSSPLADPVADGELAVFSHALTKRKALVRVRLQKVLHPLRFVDYEQDQKLLEFDGNGELKKPSAIQLTDEAGMSLIGIVEAVWSEDTLESNLMTQPVMNRVAVIECAFTDVFPPMSLKKYSYQFQYEQEETAARLPENEFFILRANADGTLSLYHKPTQRWYHGLVRLIDVADVGDEYTFDGLPEDEGLSFDSQSITIQYENHYVLIHGCLALPEQCTTDRRSRSAQKVFCDVTLKASLVPDLPRVDIKVIVDNRARDHRLMALFPLGSQAEEVLCDSILSVENHAIVRQLDVQTYEDWMEQPNNSFFIKNFAALRSNDHGLAVFVKGLPQCEVRVGDQDDQLQLTLLRCVGWLSRKDLRSRDGNGGWSIATPEAQMIGKHTFELSIFPYVLASPASLYTQATAFSVGTLAIQTSRRGAGDLTGFQSLLEITDSRLVLSALKQSENGCGYILRMVNMSFETFSACLCLNQRASVWQTNLAEVDEAYLGEGLHEVTVEAAPWKIITFRLIFCSENGKTPLLP